MPVSSAKLASVALPTYVNKPTSLSAFTIIEPCALPVAVSRWSTTTPADCSRNVTPPGLTNVDANTDSSPLSYVPADTPLRNRIVTVARYTAVPVVAESSTDAGLPTGLSTRNVPMSSKKIVLKSLLPTCDTYSSSELS